MNLWISTIRVLLLGLMLSVSSGEVMAVLGRVPTTLPMASSSNSVPSARMSAASPVAPSGLYSIHEVQLENGTSIREYATPAGLVFAVVWRGPVLPDLTALLGDYFKTFKAATDQARQLGRRGGPVSIESDKLIVRSSGRMRNFFGYAYAPDLIPVGVDIKDLLQ